MAGKIRVQSMDHGLKDELKVFSGMSPRILGYLDQVMEKGARDIADLASEGVRGMGAGLDVGNSGGFTMDSGGIPRYGEPRAPIGTQEHTADNFPIGHLAASHGIEKKGPFNYYVYNDAYYAEWVHEGTVGPQHPRPRPWLRNAFDQVRPSIIERMSKLRGMLWRL